MADLEGDKTQVEGEKPTSEEGAEPTQQKEEPTVRTYSETEFRAELDKGVGKGVSTIQGQLSRQKMEFEKASRSAKAFEAELTDLKTSYDELAEQQFSHLTEDEKTTFLDKRGIADERRSLRKEKSDLKAERETRELEIWQIGMNRKSDELVKDTGISREALKECTTESDMEVIALKFQLDKKSEAIPAPKFDSGKSSAQAGLPEHPTTEQLENASMEDYEKWARPRLDKL